MTSFFQLVTLDKQEISDCSQRWSTGTAELLHPGMCEPFIALQHMQLCLGTTSHPSHFEVPPVDQKGERFACKTPLKRAQLREHSSLTEGAHRRAHARTHARARFLSVRLAVTLYRDTTEQPITISPPCQPH